MEHTTLTSYLELLVADRESLNSVDIDALVEERLSDMRARVRTEVATAVENSKHDIDIRIATVTEAITIVARAQELEACEGEVSEVISDETY